MMAGGYALPVAMDQGSANSILFQSIDQGQPMVNINALFYGSKIARDAE